MDAADGQLIRDIRAAMDENKELDRPVLSIGETVYTVRGLMALLDAAEGPDYEAFVSIFTFIPTNDPKAYRAQVDQFRNMPPLGKDSYALRPR